jgi:hypothetical protein
MEQTTAKIIVTMLNPLEEEEEKVESLGPVFPVNELETTG